MTLNEAAKACWPDLRHFQVREVPSGVERVAHLHQDGEAVVLLHRIRHASRPRWTKHVTITDYYLGRCEDCDVVYGWVGDSYPFQA